MNIPLTQSREAVVDFDFYELVKGIRWHARKSKNGCFYAAHHAPGRNLIEMMHWYVIGQPRKGFVTDHINGNGLDNRRENLRIISIRENNQNTYRHRQGKLAGASFIKESGRWKARIQTGKTVKNLGRFLTELEAHKAYMADAQKLLAPSDSGGEKNS